jgi:HAE1 family hydrophobic/amphiphilic exporter-1
VRKEFNKIPGIERAVVQDLSLSGFSASRGFPVEFTLRGPEWNKLAELSEQFLQKMKASSKMVDVDSDYKLGQPEVRVIPNRAKAAARGVSIESIGNTVNAAIGGIRVGKYTRGGKRYDVRIRLVDKDRERPQDISSLWVRNDQGEVIPLSQVVTMKTESTLLGITRKNRERAISLFANMAPGVSQQEALKTVQELAKSLPTGYRAVFSGSAQTFQESFQSLIIALILGIFVAYMVLGSQFNSFLHPAIVLLALPFSVTGAFAALWISGKSLNIFSMIGIILLMGIVKKNSILLVDFTNERRKKGDDTRTALLNACPVRLRPILMTSFATIAAAIPPALGFGPGAETRIPMALVVIGGVIVSTFLTLFVVPSAYSLFQRFESHTHDANLREALIELGELPPEEK